MHLGKRNHASIVKPLRGMVENLKSYIKEQEEQQTRLQQEIDERNKRIDTAALEIKKSSVTRDKISDLLGLDVDGNGIPDIEEGTIDETKTTD
jgi:hypothetical protein